MNAPNVTWSQPPASAADLDADIAATVVLARADWEALGAIFVEADDGDGEWPGLAVGTAATSHGHVDFGVLDYGSDTTYLLTPRASEGAREVAMEILELLAAGVSSPIEVVELAGDPSAASLEERVAELERQLRILQAGSLSSERATVAAADYVQQIATSIAATWLDPVPAPDHMTLVGASRRRHHRRRAEVRSGETSSPPRASVGYWVVVSNRAGPDRTTETKRSGSDPAPRLKD